MRRLGTALAVYNQNVQQKNIRGRPIPLKGRGSTQNSHNLWHPLCPRKTFNSTYTGIFWLHPAPN